MKRSILAFTTLLTTTLALSSVARADEQADKQAIMNLYQTSVDAACNKDHYNVNQELTNYAPGYTQTATDGKLYSLEQVRQAKQHEHSQGVSQTWQIHINPKQWKINGQVANALYEQQTEIRVYALNHKTGQPILGYVDIKRVGLYEDTWQHTNSGWKLVNTHVLQENAVSGKPQYPQVSNADRTLNHVIELEKVRAHQSVMDQMFR